MTTHEEVQQFAEDVKRRGIARWNAEQNPRSIDFRLAPEAEAELDDMWLHLARDSGGIEIATRVATKLRSTSGCLRSIPMSAVPATRICDLGSTASAVILNVVHESRDMADTSTICFATAFSAIAFSLISRKEAGKNRSRGLTASTRKHLIEAASEAADIASIGILNANPAPKG